jgi:hypothetical protein
MKVYSNLNMVGNDCNGRSTRISQKRDRRFCRTIAPITKSDAKHHLGYLPFGYIAFCATYFQSIVLLGATANFA